MVNCIIFWNLGTILKSIFKTIVIVIAIVAYTVSTVLTAALLFKSSFVGAGLKREFT